MKTGIFGGSFDPPHVGHLRLAESAFASLGLDRLIVIPAYVSPEKTGPAAAEHRLAMCRLTFGGFFTVSDIEMRRGGRSYTFDTVTALGEQYPEDEFFLIVGADQLLNFDTWYRYEDVLKRVTLCAAVREKNGCREALDAFARKKLSPSGRAVTFSHDPVEISSTEIRRRVREGADVSAWLTEETAQYIRTKGLYRDN